MEILGERIFGIPVYKLHYGVSEKVLSDIDKLTAVGGDEPPESWVGDLKTSFSAGYNFLDDSIKDEFCEMAIHLLNNAPESVRPVEKLIANCWYNDYREGHFQEPHRHCPSTLSAVWFLRGDPCDLRFVPPISFFPFIQISQPFSPELGDVLFFPSGLTHYVSPAKKHRTTVAFNFSPTHD